MPVVKDDRISIISPCSPWSNPLSDGSKYHKLIQITESFICPQQ
ncbi:hypothetical protein OH687_33785 [Burkholderia anthina]|nr:hypothetical protein OH687_33785 [Burkholderia anthina]